MRAVHVLRVRFDDMQHGRAQFPALEVPAKVAAARAVDIDLDERLADGVDPVSQGVAGIDITSGPALAHRLFERSLRVHGVSLVGAYVAGGGGRIADIVRPGDNSSQAAAIGVLQLQATILAFPCARVPSHGASLSAMPEAPGKT